MHVDQKNILVVFYTHRFFFRLHTHTTEACRCFLSFFFFLSLFLWGAGGGVKPTQHRRLSNTNLDVDYRSFDGHLSMYEGLKRFSVLDELKRTSRSCCMQDQHACRPEQKHTRPGSSVPLG